VQTKIASSAIYTHVRVAVIKIWNGI